MHCLRLQHCGASLPDTSSSRLYNDTSPVHSLPERVLNRPHTEVREFFNFICFCLVWKGKVLCTFVNREKPTGSA